MNQEELAARVLGQGQDETAEYAIHFYTAQPALKKIRLSQFYQLKILFDEAEHWEGLMAKVETFLQKQSQKDEKLGLTQWSPVKDKLLAFFSGLPEAKVKGRTLREWVTKKLEKIDPDLKYFFQDGGEEIRKSREALLHYHLAKHTLACLYRLQRGQEELEEITSVTSGGKILWEGCLYV